MQPGPERDPLALTVLTGWHHVLRELVDELEAPPQFGDWAPEPELRDKVRRLIRLRSTLCQQGTAKLRLLWPVYGEHVHGGAAIAQVALEQKLHLEVLLLKTEWVDDRSRAMDALVQRLAHGVREHLGFEASVLPRLLDAGGAVDLDRLGERLARAARHAPVRPHADLPAGRVPAMLFGPPLALIDRLRDALSPLPKGG